MTERLTLTELRSLRDAAWAAVHSDIDALQDGLATRGIGERVKDRAAEEAREALDHAVDIASEHRGVIAATVLALIAWFLRGPIGDLFAALFGDEEEPGEGQNVDTDKGDVQ